MPIPLPTIRRCLHGLLIFGLLGWFVVALAQEIDRNANRQREGYPRRTLLWRAGMAPVQELEAVLRQVDRVLPAGDRLAFMSPDELPGNAFFRQRWAAYLLAEREIIPFPLPDIESHASYLLAYGVEPSSSDFELVLRLEPPAYQLYRIRSPRP